MFKVFLLELALRNDLTGCSSNKDPVFNVRVSSRTDRECVQVTSLAGPLVRDQSDFHFHRHGSSIIIL